MKRPRSLPSRGQQKYFSSESRGTIITHPLSFAYSPSRSPLAPVAWHQEFKGSIECWFAATRLLSRDPNFLPGTAVVSGLFLYNLYMQGHHCASDVRFAPASTVKRLKKIHPSKLSNSRTPQQMDVLVSCFYYAAKFTASQKRLREFTSSFRDVMRDFPNSSLLNDLELGTFALDGVVCDTLLPYASSFYRWYLCFRGAFITACSASGMDARVKRGFDPVKQWYLISNVLCILPISLAVPPDELAVFAVALVKALENKSDTGSSSQPAATPLPRQVPVAAQNPQPAVAPPYRTTQRQPSTPVTRGLFGTWSVDRSAAVEFSVAGAPGAPATLEDGAPGAPATLEDGAPGAPSSAPSPLCSFYRDVFTSGDSAVTNVLAGIPQGMQLALGSYLVAGLTDIEHAITSRAATNLLEKVSALRKGLVELSPLWAPEYHQQIVTELISVGTLVSTDALRWASRQLPSAPDSPLPALARPVSCAGVYSAHLTGGQAFVVDGIDSNAVAAAAVAREASYDVYGC